MPATETAKISTKGDVVSQSEIENLLAMVGSDGGGEAMLPVVGKDSSSESPSQRYEFPSASTLTPGELRKLRVRHEEFIRTLASRLSLHLRMECNLQMLKLETTTFRQFIDGLNNPTHLTLFRLEPFKGICLIDMPLRLALSLVDREMGGPAVVTDEARELSKMETRLLSKVVEIILAEWCSSWRESFDLRPALIRTENNGRFLQTHLPQTTMLVLGVEARLGGVLEPFQLCFPCHTLEPLLVKLDSEADKYDSNKDGNKSRPPSWNPAFNDLNINVQAELPELEITARELGSLKPGDVIPMSPDLANRVRIILESSPKFTGSLGVSGRQLAVQISHILKS
jgi:flagellar motor switch protein FliM